MKPIIAHNKKINNNFLFKICIIYTTRRRGDSYGITDLYVSSVTYAMRGQKILLSHGIRAKIKRNINKSNNSGCGYVLSVSSKDSARAAEILNAEGIRSSNQ